MRIICENIHVRGATGGGEGETTVCSGGVLEITDVRKSWRAIFSKSALCPDLFKAPRQISKVLYNGGSVSAECSGS